MGNARASVAALAVGVGLFWAAPAWAAVEFDPVPLTTTPDVQEIVLANDGADPFELDRPAIKGTDAGAFRVVSEDCSGLALYPGEECGVEVSFQPSRIGIHKAVLEAAVLDGDEPLRIDLSGEGRPALRVTPARLDFGVLGSARSSRDVTFQNLTNEEIDFHFFTPRSGSGRFSFGRISCFGFKLAPGASCTVTVGFFPWGPGVYNSELRIERPSGTLATVPLSGTYLGRPAAPKPPPPPTPTTAAILSTRLTGAVRQWRHARRARLRRTGFLLTGLVPPADGKLELILLGRHDVARGALKVRAGRPARLMARPTRTGRRLLRLDRKLRLRAVLRFAPSTGGPKSRVATELWLPRG